MSDNTQEQTETQKNNERQEYDIIIAGSGPAGLTAAIYAARYKLSTLVLGKEFGGTIGKAHKVCNFPTYMECSGTDLMMKMEEQTRSLGVQIEYDPITNVKHEEDGRFCVTTSLGKQFCGKKIVYSVGTERRTLDIQGETEFLGKGVSYCATCDGAFFRDKVVAVIGGSDAALTSALLLSEYASKVIIIYRQDKFFRAEPSWVELVEKNEKIEVKFNSNLKEIAGSVLVEKVILESGEEVAVDGVFIEVGSAPNNAILKDIKIDMTEKGYIKTDKEQKTNVEGFFAAGDITDNPLKQAITAAGEGAVAAFTAYKEITRTK